MTAVTQSTTLRTDRLLLRPHRFADMEDGYAYASDPEFSRFLPLPQPYGHLPRQPRSLLKRGHGSKVVRSGIESLLR